MTLKGNIHCVWKRLHLLKLTTETRAAAFSCKDIAQYNYSSFWHYKVCVDMCGGFQERGIQTTVGWSKTWIFGAFDTTSSAVLELRLSLLYSCCSIIYFFRRLSTDPKIHDLEWLWMAWMGHFTLYFQYSEMAILWVLFVTYLPLVSECWLVSYTCSECCWRTEIKSAVSLRQQVFLFYILKWQLGGFLHCRLAKGVRPPVQNNLQSIG